MTKGSALARAADLGAAPLLALLSYGLLHWKGIGMFQDGWAAWQGAASLAAGRGYTYFSGNPIVAWPPLYSAYMAPWMVLLGPSGWSLLLSNGLLIVVQAFLWNRLLRTMADDSGFVLPAVPSLVLSIFLGLLISVQQRSVLSHNLVYVLLPIYLGVIWRGFRTKRVPGSPIDTILLVALGTALLLTHNSTIAFLVSASAILLIARPDVKGALSAATTVAVPLAGWLAIRAALDQSGSHHVGLGAGKYSPLDYAVQLLDGPGGLLMFGRYGIGVTAMVLLWLAVLLMIGHRKAVALRFGATFVLIASAILYLLFNLSWVFNALGSNRFILFAPLILGPLAYITALSVRPHLATIAAFAALVPQLYWTGSWAVGQYTSSLTALEYPQSFASPQSYISPSYRSGPPVPTAQGNLIPFLTQEEPKGRTK